MPNYAIPTANLADILGITGAIDLSTLPASAVDFPDDIEMTIVSVTGTYTQPVAASGGSLTAELQANGTILVDDQGQTGTFDLPLLDNTPYPLWEVQFSVSLQLVDPSILVDPVISNTGGVLQLTTPALVAADTDYGAVSVQHQWFQDNTPLNSPLSGDLVDGSLPELDTNQVGTGTFDFRTSVTQDGVTVVAQSNEFTFTPPPVEFLTYQGALEVANVAYTPGTPVSVGSPIAIGDPAQRAEIYVAAFHNTFGGNTCDIDVLEIAGVAFQKLGVVMGGDRLYGHLFKGVVATGTTGQVAIDGATAETVGAVQLATWTTSGASNLVSQNPAVSAVSFGSDQTFDVSQNMLAGDAAIVAIAHNFGRTIGAVTGATNDANLSGISNYQARFGSFIADADVSPRPMTVPVGANSSRAGFSSFVIRPA